LWISGAEGAVGSSGVGAICYGWQKEEDNLSRKRIVFVCLGNIVRSPLAENMFRHLAKERGVEDRYEVDSAGTGSWHVGERPDRRMRRVAAQRGLQYDGRARQFSRKDFQRFDLIIAMDTNNRENLMSLAQSEEDREKIHLLREFDDQSGSEASVPDPYYGGIEGFERTYDIVERSCETLLDTLEDGRIDP
jgi:protein-tyrosine phosphatase